MTIPAPKFKAGDRVKQLSNCSGSVKGKKYILAPSSPGGTILASGGPGHCTCKYNWKLLKPKSTTMASKKPITHIVTWDVDGTDPVQKFSDAESATKFAQALVLGNQEYIDEHDDNGDIDVSEVDKKSVRVYVVKGAFTVKTTCELVATKQ